MSNQAISDEQAKKTSAFVLGKKRMLEKEVAYLNELFEAIRAFIDTGNLAKLIALSRKKWVCNRAGGMAHPTSPDLEALQGFLAPAQFAEVQAAAEDSRNPWKGCGGMC